MPSDQAEGWTRRSIVKRAGLLLAAGVGIYAGGLRRRQLCWGVSDEEARSTLPGDELLSSADLVATRGIDVRAPRHEVWPWVAQLGQGRAGFYSYEAMENLAGCDIHNADRIVPEWQHPQVGDPFRLHPDVALEVALVDPGHALVIAGIQPENLLPDAPAPFDFTWAFVTQDRGDGGSRLLARERYLYRSRWTAAMVEPVSIVSFLMTERMLRGIRDRAEAAVSPIATTT
jgi:hypothetical protein